MGTEIWLIALNAITAERDVLRSRVAELEAELKRIMSRTRCAYCGHEVAIDDDAATQISEHIMSCEKHPLHIALRAYEEVNAALTKEREKIKGLEDKLDEFRKSERALSEAYIRIRSLVGAWNTRPGGTDRFEVTENKIKSILERAKELEALVDGATEIVEIFTPSSPAQEE